MHKELIPKVAGPPRSPVPLRPAPAHQSNTHSALLHHPMHPSLCNLSVLPQPQPAFFAYSPTPQAPNPLATRLRASHNHPVPPPWNLSCRHQDILEMCCENLVRAETQSSQKPQATGRRVPLEEPSTTSIKTSIAEPAIHLLHSEVHDWRRGVKGDGTWMRRVPIEVPASRLAPPLTTLTCPPPAKR